MKFFKGLAMMMAGASACQSSSTCRCPTDGFTKSTALVAYDGPTVCVHRETVPDTYLNAKAICAGLNATFPHVDAQEDLVKFTGLVGTDSESWVQAEKRGNWFSSSWRDWSGDRLRNLMWADDLDEPGADEPTRGDKFGYIVGGAVWGAAQEATRPYSCMYSIEHLCT